MRKQLYLRLKYRSFDLQTINTDYKLYNTDNEYALYKNHCFSKKGTLNELKEFLRKQYKIYLKQRQREIARIIGDPYVSNIPIPNLKRYL